MVAAVAPFAAGQPLIIWWHRPDTNGVAPTKTGDVIGTILKVKHLAADVGGLKKLGALVQALGE
jgi:hypothetical protein